MVLPEGHQQIEAAAEQRDEFSVAVRRGSGDGGVGTSSEAPALRLDYVWDTGWEDIVFHDYPWDVEREGALCRG